MIFLAKELILLKILRGIMHCIIKGKYDSFFTSEEILIFACFAYLDTQIHVLFLIIYPYIKIVDCER